LAAAEGPGYFSGFSFNAASSMDPALLVLFRF
jgi:hypothetical protein